MYNSLTADINLLYGYVNGRPREHGDVGRIMHIVEKAH